MCGIVGAIAQRKVAAILLEGLKRLEYRGYDSAGMVVRDPSSGELICTRRSGKVAELESAYAARSVSPTRAGPPMVNPRSVTPIHISPAIG